jgi:hypothetical protein
VASDAEAEIENDPTATPALTGVPTELPFTADEAEAAQLPTQLAGKGGQRQRDAFCQFLPKMPPCSTRCLRGRSE